MDNMTMENADAVFDEIIASINDYGKFQKRFSFFYNLVFNIICSMPYMSLLLIMAVPDHWCYIPGRENSSKSLDEWKDMYLPKEENSWGTMTHSQCKMYNLSTITAGSTDSTAKQIECQNGYEYDHTWYYNTIPSSYDWVCEKDMYVTNMFTAATVGEIVGSFILGQVGDYVGRRPVYIIANFMSVFGNGLILLTARYHYVMLVSCFISYFPSQTALQSILAISMEITKPEMRAQLAQIQNYGWCLSMVVLSFVCWAIPDWTIYYTITSLPLIIYIFTYKSLIESPRWLAARGRIDDCVKELEKIAKTNGKKLQPDMLEKLRASSSVPEKVYGIASTMSSWRLAKNTVVLTFALIVYTLCYGTFMLNTTNLGGNPFLQFLFQSLIELPGYVIGKYLCDKIGRRYTGTFSYLGSVFMFIIVVITIEYKSTSNIMNIFILSAKFCLSVAYYTQTLQTMEIYPTCLRQTGMSLGIVVSGIFGILSPYIVYIGTEYDARYPYFIIGFLCFVAAIIQMLLPETFHVKLPETLQEAKVFGKDQKFFGKPWESPQVITKVVPEEESFIT